MRKAALLLALIALILVSGCVQSSENQQNASSNSVEISNFAYSPQEVTVKVGDTVTWTNMDSAIHTVTSDNGNELDSATLSQGDTYSHTFESAGTYDYHCTIHPYMKGKVVVE